MHREEIDRIAESLPPLSRRFPYFKDRYALLLLSYAVPRPRSIRALKRTTLGKLLNKPILTDLCGRLGGGRLSRDDLRSLQPDSAESYDLTIGHWGDDDPGRRWAQMSRPGWNLVLQLNLEQGLGEVCRELLGHDDDGVHPHARGRFTLAWTRMDIDLAAREALIEEVQSDWTDECSRAVLRPHSDFWDEAMLAAAIRLLHDDLGVHRIYYHTIESGNRFKGFSTAWGAPPRSVYTTLPKRFCFERTTRGPTLLRTHRRCRKTLRRHPVPWFVLQV